MSPGPTFDRVYAALKEQLLSGRWAPGAHLEPAVLGDDLSASVTPVRDALHRLVGERLVDAPRHDGFWVPSTSEGQLRLLYGWNRDLLVWALRRQPWPCAVRGPGIERPVDPAHLFRELAGAAGDPELEYAVAAAIERLAAFRAAETGVFGDLPEETWRLNQCLTHPDKGPLRRELTAYHRRRIRAVAHIIAARTRLER